MGMRLSGTGRTWEEGTHFPPPALRLPPSNTPYEQSLAVSLSAEKKVMDRDKALVSQR